jgi:4a-hydroxytetrahydrobiopterin dehydratase
MRFFCFINSYIRRDFVAVLSDNQIKEKLTTIPEWNFESNQNNITKEFQLKNFVDALDFVNKVGVFAEEMNHHPDIFLHSWNKVKITISTHSEGGVTEKDFELAEKLESIK